MRSVFVICVAKYITVNYKVKKISGVNEPDQQQLRFETLLGGGLWWN